MTPMTTDGLTQFHIAIKVDVATMKEWPPERITLFFDGMAKVVAANNVAALVPFLPEER